MTTPALNCILLRLEAVRGPDAQGWYTARCPRAEAHRNGDAHPSFRLSEGGYKCLAPSCELHQGGSLWRLARLLGLEDGGALPERRNGHQQQRRQAEDPLSWWAERCGVPREWLRGLPIEAHEGAVAFAWPGLETKKLRSPGSKGWWEPDDGPRPALWPALPEAAPPVLVLCEGESDGTVAAYLLEATGLTEVASAHGVTKGASQRPDGALLRELAARGFKAVLLVPDADAAGQAWAKAWAQAAREAGLAAEAFDLVARGLISPSLGEKDLRDAHRRPGIKLMAELRAAVEALGGAPNLTSDYIPLPIGSKVSTEQPGVSAAELRAQAPRELAWLLFLGEEGFIWEGSVALLSGYPKVGKSSLLAWLALEWAQGERRVHILTEEGLEVWRRRLAAMPDGPWERVTVQPALGLGVDGLCQALREVEADIFIVDTWRKVCPLKSFRDTAEVNAAFTQILAAHQEAQARRGRPITLVLAHHDRKSSEGAEEGQRVADSHVIFGSVDTVLELVRDEGDRRLVRGWGRLMEPPTVVIERAQDGKLRIIGSPQEVALAEVKLKVLAALSEAEGWPKTKEVRDALPTPRPSDDQVRRALVELAREGRVERDPPLSQGTKQGATYRWRLAPEFTSNGTYTSWKESPAGEGRGAGAPTSAFEPLAQAPSSPPNLTSDEGGYISGSKVPPCPGSSSDAGTEGEATPPPPAWAQKVLEHMGAPLKNGP